MKPESELQAEEVAFVNTCEKHAALLAILDRGRHQFELCVYDPKTGARLARFGTYVGVTDREGIGRLSLATEPLTGEEFDKILELGTAKLPTLPPVEKLPTIPPPSNKPLTPEEAQLIADESLPETVAKPKRKGK
jgi:hypothetical protein